MKTDELAARIYVNWVQGDSDKDAEWLKSVVEAAYVAARVFAEAGNPKPKPKPNVTATGRFKIKGPPHQ